ncbi:TetR/AcrR family transcriptional regulator [Luteibacter sp. UNC138MFCol5.1]|uniref:TetR/AcrR family transcriptional regulator n=1 Tax=Luteibacter sp. UNC138MFCol5.1 TaxID=1502774 RepID=UPI002100F334|nr:TetR/AcrR family transcriptional regulator [Luteibacter sp. UNC138MFCol5.1]
MIHGGSLLNTGGVSPSLDLGIAACLCHSHMPAAPEHALKPRKRPRQARSAATVEAIFEATIQVLLSDGLAGLTTTRVAGRAGVSVGTMYQYFPHKDALLYAVLEDYLDDVVGALETASDRYRGLPLAEMSDGLVHAYLDAKMRHLPGAQVLYVVATELETTDLMGDICARCEAPIARMLATASDVRFDDLARVTDAFRAMLGGVVRAILENDVSPRALAMLRTELPVMCRAYLQASARLVEP